MIENESVDTRDLREKIAEILASGRKVETEELQELLREGGQYLVDRFFKAYNIEQNRPRKFEIGNLRYEVNESGSGYRLRWSTSRNMYDDNGMYGQFSEGMLTEKSASGNNLEAFPLRSRIWRGIEIDDPNDFARWDHRPKNLTGLEAFEAFNVVLDRELPNK